MRKQRLAYQKAKYCQLQMVEMDARVLKALIDSGGGNRYQIAAYTAGEVSMSTIDRALARFMRFGLVRHSIQNWWVVSDRGAIAWAIWAAKRRLSEYR